MNRSKTGQFYGVTSETILLEGVTLTDTEYTQDRVPWHYHEHDYFTFILEGCVLEGNKKDIYECSAGDLLYHNWQDAHYNIGSPEYTRGFHLELAPAWYARFDIDAELTQGSIRISDPQIKMGMYNIFKETKLSGTAGQLGIDALLVDIFANLGRIGRTAENKKPKWVATIKELLNDAGDNWRLTDLAKLVNIHPVHLSREFPRYFHTTLGDYVRIIRLQRALSLLPDPELSLTDIALQCNFADQSHFIRSFKTYYHLAPLHYRKLLQKRPGR